MQQRLYRWRHARRPAWGAAAALAALALAPAAAAPGDPRAPSPISMSGSTGLVRVPTAEVLPYGHYAVGVNKIERAHRPFPTSPKDTVAHFISIGVLPRVEVTGTFTNHEGNLGARFHETLPNQDYGGWDFDRMFSIQVQLARQNSHWPVSVGAGYQDFLGTGVFKARYLVATRRWPALGMHVGLGDGVLGSVFGGIDYQVSPRVRLMLDHDGHRANFGVSVGLSRFRVTPILTGLSSLGGGVSYTQRL